MTQGKLPRRVAVVQRILPHYRLAFFEQLHERLGAQDIDLDLIYGQARPNSAPQSVTLDKQWAHRIANKYLAFGSTELVWQPCWGITRAADLVIVEHASRLLVNYVLSLRRASNRHRLAYWGHGRDMQGLERGALSARIKHLMTERADWWFAYTSLSARLIRDSGYPEARLTVVENAIDTAELRDAWVSCRQEEVETRKRALGIGGDNVAIYCGSMYDHKRLPFLLEACARVRSAIRDFSVIFVGDGPCSQLVVRAAETHSWIRYVGPQYGRDLAAYFRMGKVLLIPAAVGLVIVDSFVVGVPLFTTDSSNHGPEIAYLQNGVNGIMTTASVEEYTAAITQFLRDPALLDGLRKGCRASAQRYTLNNMVENFSNGVIACLAHYQQTASPG